MPQYKLTYFDIRARAEVARYLFALAGVEYEDKRVTQEEWQKMKPNVPNPFHQLPILEKDGNVMIQSNAISNYLAMEFGFHGNDNMEKYKIEMVGESIYDMSKAMMTANFEKDEEKKAKLTEDFYGTFLPKWLSAMEKILKESTGDYFVGNRITLADVGFIFSCDYLLAAKPDAFKDHPGLSGLYDRLAANPKIADWRKNRPQTMF
ncbi:S-crystallin SL11 [Trichoplax sp. H2]|nr:S-crystallin SL11 [Trichoplax sp. H2]|eukprot:RDD47888.1 S-crystallin SL11 [Trichoplax sp. H2]